MSNAITAFNKEYWAAEMQTIFFKENVAIALANTELREVLTDGDYLNKPYRSHPQAVTYTKGTDITVKDRFSTNEQLHVATAKVVPFYVDDIDKIQNKWDSASKFAQDGQRLLNNILDQIILGEAGANSALSYVDAGHVGGSVGSNITPSTSNISQIFTAASRILDQADVPQAKRFACVGPRLLEVIRLYIGGKDTSAADLVGENGKVMNRFGFEIYYSNNSYYSARWTPADNPTAAGYITINGAVLEFVAVPDADEASTAYIGVDIGSTTAVSIDNAVAAINDSGTAGTTYGVTDAANDAARWKLSKAGVVATDGTTYLGIVGYGDIVVATSDANDPWSVQTQNLLFGMKGATDLVLQKSPEVEFRIAEKRLGRYVYPWMLYGYLTFADMEEALVNVKINASAWT